MAQAVARMFETSFIMLSHEALQSPIQVRWMDGGCCWRPVSFNGTKMREASTRDISNAFFFWRFFVCFFHHHQGILLKRSGSSLNKEWKKKYVTLSNDGILSYHSSVNVSLRVLTQPCELFRWCRRDWEFVCLGRSICWTLQGKRWTCFGWLSRCLESGPLVLCLHAAPLLGLMDGLKMCWDLRVKSRFAFL